MNSLFVLLNRKFTIVWYMEVMLDTYHLFCIGVLAISLNT